MNIDSDFIYTLSFIYIYLNMLFKVREGGNEEIDLNVTQHI